MNAFADANDILFEDENVSVEALWRAGGTGAGVPVRIIIGTPDEEVGWQRTRLVSAAVVIDVRLSEVAVLSSGDTFEVPRLSTEFTVDGDPQRDDMHLTWQAGAHRS